MPQSRQRLIFVGVRNDLKGNPQHPTPLGYNYTVRDAVRDAVNISLAGNDKIRSLQWCDADRPSPSIMQSDAKRGEGAYLSAGGWVEAESEDGIKRRKFTVAELRRICGFPDDFILTGTYQQQWERLGRAVPPVMMMHIARAVQRTLDANGALNE